MDVGRRLVNVKKLTRQTVKDRLLTDERVMRNQARRTFVGKALEPHFGPIPRRKDLLVVAREFDTINLDRLAKRSRECLLCWFCENWTVIEPVLPTVCARVLAPAPAPPVVFDPTVNATMVLADTRADTEYDSFDPAVSEFDFRWDDDMDDV
jgi:hypothetical protein